MEHSQVYKTRRDSGVGGIPAPCLDPGKGGVVSSSAPHQDLHPHSQQEPHSAAVGVLKDAGKQKVALEAVF